MDYERYFKENSPWCCDCGKELKENTIVANDILNEWVSTCCNESIIFDKADWAETFLGYATFVCSDCQTGFDHLEKKNYRPATWGFDGGTPAEWDDVCPCCHSENWEEL
jgi:hypothetical protein